MVSARRSRRLADKIPQPPAVSEVTFSETSAADAEQARSRNVSDDMSTVSTSTVLNAFAPHCGVFSAQGRREYQEDAFSVIPSLFTALPTSAAIEASEEQPVQFFGVFDGHGGSEASVFASTKIRK